jgi:hypothetical protein
MGSIEKLRRKRVAQEVPRVAEEPAS